MGNPKIETGNLLENMIETKAKVKLHIIAEVRDHVFINNHDPRLFEGFQWVILKLKQVIY